MGELRLIHHFVSALLQSASRHGVEVPLDLDERGDWSHRELALTIRTVGRRLDDAFFGLASSRCPPDLNKIGHELLVFSDTLGDALERNFRLFHVLTGGLRMSLARDGSSARITLQVTDPTLDPMHILPEWYTIRIRGLAQWLIGERISLRYVEFAHQCVLSTQDYAAVMSDQTVFNGTENYFEFPSHLLQRRVVRSIRDIPALDASDSMSGPHRHMNWGNLIRKRLLISLRDISPLPTMEELASEFRISGQTLRRNLINEGTSYHEVKADARKEIVLSNISDPSLTLDQISVLAGYADTYGLVRAIKSWTGLSPSAFRRLAVEGADIRNVKPGSRH